MKRKHFFKAMLLAGALTLAAGPAMSQNTTDSIPEQNGPHWTQTPSDKERALLFLLTALALRSQAGIGGTTTEGTGREARQRLDLACIPPEFSVSRHLHTLSEGYHD